MLLDLTALIAQRNLKISGILHVGAHLAEEAELYHTLGIDNVWWVEANVDNMVPIRNEVKKYSPDQRIILACVSDKDGDEVVFHITNNESMSSSLFEFGTHPTFSPETVFVEHRTMKTTTIDTIAAHNNLDGVNFLNMDIQGAELLALKGANKFIDKLDYIYCEVNCEQVYKGCAQVGDIDVLLDDRGFKRVETGWVPRQGWGDALYVRSGLI